MKNKIHSAFEDIRATDDLKQNINSFVHSKMIKKQSKKRIYLSYAAACCAVVIFAICGIAGYSFYQIPVSYISIDINPSVELALNTFNRVVDTTSYNDDGTVILQNLDLNNKLYTKAVDMLISDENFKGYLSDNASLSFTIISDNEEALLAGVQQCKGYSEVNAQCYGADKQLREEAHNNGLSFGKYKAFLELSKYDSTVTVEECKHLSMKQIREFISNYKNTVDTPAQENVDDKNYTNSNKHEKNYGYRGGGCSVVE